MYTYIHSYIHTYTHACIHTFIHICILCDYSRLYIHTYIQIQTCMRTYTHTYMNIPREYSCTYIHTYIHAQIPTYINTPFEYPYISTCTYIHTYHVKMQESRRYLLCTDVRTYMHAYIHTYIPCRNAGIGPLFALYRCTYTHTYIHTYIPCRNAGIGPLYCRLHMREGDMNMHARMCQSQNCTSLAIFGSESDRVIKFCAVHKLPTHMDLRNRYFYPCAFYETCSLFVFFCWLYTVLPMRKCTAVLVVMRVCIQACKGVLKYKYKFIRTHKYMHRHTHGI